MIGSVARFLCGSLFYYAGELCLAVVMRPCHGRAIVRVKQRGLALLTCCYVKL